LTATHELETVLWNTPRWEWKKGKAGFTMEELCVMDFEKKKMKFEEPDHLAKWIWKQS